MITKLFGLIVVMGSLACVYLFEGSTILTGHWKILHWPALVLTGLGPLGIVLMCSDGRLIRWALTAMLSASPRRARRRQDRDAIFLQKLGKAFYAEGPAVFDRIKAGGLSKPVQKTIERMAIRMPTPDIRDLMEDERHRRQCRLIQCLNTVGLGVKLAPSVGMLGTIIGMVQLLSTLNDPSHIGSHMSMALLTTFYGLFFSLVIWTPLQQKVERALDVEIEGYEQVIRWLELLEKRKPADYFAESVGIAVQRGEGGGKKNAAA